MSDNEGFLARWSRRKREAAAPANLAKPAAAKAGEDPMPAPPVEAGSSGEVELPSIDSIASASDISGFLATGVPLELTRAALRRAWTVDPAIRDFVGLSENAWDFNAPDGVPGFGTLDLDQVKQLVERLLGEPKSSEPANPPATPTELPERVEDTVACAGPPVVDSPEDSTGACNEETARNPRQHAILRRHGAALPK